MLPMFLKTVPFAIVAAIALSVPGLDAMQAPPRRPPESRPEAAPQKKADGGQQAKPRQPSEPQRKPDAGQQARPRQPSGPPPRDDHRRASPPPRVVPPRYHATPRAYYFPPISLNRGFYYHPYFGFYYGPYYGPYYPYPGPFYGPAGYSASAFRLRVAPVETEVYINGYYAGLADDFDGLFQRLYVPAGEHEIELRLEGYQSFGMKVYVSPGDTREIMHRMLPLPPGETLAPVSAPRALPDAWTAAAGAPAGDRPASPFGILVLRVEPIDAQIVVDGDAWAATGSQRELVLHVTAGWHALEVRKDGYQTLKTDIELSEGATTRLNVKLVR